MAPTWLVFIAGMSAGISLTVLIWSYSLRRNRGDHVD